MKIEANLLPKREPIETNRAVDWFSTLKETETTMKRLYNPRLRTSESQKVWNKLPGFLEKNKDLLSFCMGTESTAVHLHGSMLLGVGTEGKRVIVDDKSDMRHMWEIPPSDIDLIIFVGEKDENEQKYQAKYGAEDKELSDYLKERKREFRFDEQINFKNEFNRYGDINSTVYM